MNDTKRGYMILISGLGDGFEWEARYTGVFTSKRRAEKEMRAMRGHDERFSSSDFSYAVVAVEVPKRPKKASKR
jgi:hypothetical protein